MSSEMNIIACILVVCAFFAWTSAEIRMPAAQTTFEANPQFSPNEKFKDMAILTSGNFTKSVLDSQEAWVIIVHDGTLTRSWKTMSATSRGLIWVGMVDKTTEGELLKSIKFDPENSGRVYPHGNKFVKNKYYTDVKSPMEARQAAFKSIPNKIRPLDASNLEGFLLDSYKSTPSRFPVVILSDDPAMSGLNKALAVRFEKYFNFASVVNPTTKDLQLLGIQTLFFEFPTLIALIFKRKDDGVSGNEKELSSDVNALAFDTQTMGEMNYANVVQFLFSINAQFRHTLPGENLSNQQVEAEMLDIVEIERKRFAIKGKEDVKKNKKPEEVVEDDEEKVGVDDEHLLKNVPKPKFDEDGQMIFGDVDEDELIEQILKNNPHINDESDDIGFKKDEL